MLELHKDQVFPLSRPPAWLVGRSGKPVHPSTLRRWAALGLQGGRVKLEIAKLGGVRVTSTEAVARFAARLMVDDNPVAVTGAGPVRAERPQEDGGQSAIAGGDQVAS